MNTSCSVWLARVSGEGKRKTNKQDQIQSYEFCGKICGKMNHSVCIFQQKGMKPYITQTEPSQVPTWAVPRSNETGILQWETIYHPLTLCTQANSHTTWEETKTTQAVLIPVFANLEDLLPLTTFWYYFSLYYILNFEQKRNVLTTVFQHTISQQPDFLKHCSFIFLHALVASVNYKGIITMTAKLLLFFPFPM